MAPSLYRTTLRSGVGSNQVLWEANDPEDPEWVDPLHGLGAPVFDFTALEVGWSVVAAADIDGDGLDELVMASLGGTDDHELTLSIMDDAAAAFARTEYPLGDWPDVINLTLAAGDFGGDGVDTVVVSLSFVDSAELVFLQGVGADPGPS